MNHPPQEPELIRPRPILVAIAAVLAAIAVGVAAAVALRAEPSIPPIPDEVNAMETTVFRAGAPGLTDHAGAEIQLHSYGWVDRRRGIVRIPIDAAWDLYLRRAEAR